MTNDELSDLTEWERNVIKHLYPSYPMATKGQWKTIAIIIDELMREYYIKKEIEIND